MGPALFLIYVNSLLSAVRNSKVMTFADGTKMYKEIKSRDDCASLQEDLDSLSAWSADTGLSFNVPNTTSKPLQGNDVQSPQATRLLAASLILQRQSVIWVCLYPVNCPCKQALGIHLKGMLNSL